jgi:hypothetical protein
MRTARGVGAAIAGAALIVLVGCTSDEAATPVESSSASPDATPAAESTGTGAAASPTASATAPATSTAPSVTPSPAAPASTPPAPAATTAAPPAPPPAQPDQPQQIPDPEAGQAAVFQTCSQQYLDLTRTITLSPTVTPVVVEGWAEAYQAASALAAEGSYRAAATACQELVATITRATR